VDAFKAKAILYPNRDKKIENQSIAILAWLINEVTLFCVAKAIPNFARRRKK